MHAPEGKAFSNISATPASFALRGGKYGVAAIATWTAGSAKLQKLGPDGSTFLSVSAGTDFTANGYATVDLPPGTYQLTIATATAVYFALDRIPGE